MGGRFRRDGIYAYIQLIHTVVQQKLTQHCKAIILQLKKIALLNASTLEICVVIKKIFNN